MIEEYTYWLNHALQWLDMAEHATADACWYVQHRELFPSFDRVNEYVKSANERRRNALAGYQRCINHAESYL